MGKVLLIHQDHEFCNAVNARLERLFFLDGRDKPDHPHYYTYTGLAQKYSLPNSNGKDLPTR